MINGAVDNGFNAISHTFNKSFDEAVRKAIDKAVKGAVIKSGGKWTD
jgi:methylmalonyl-CoA mutase cobalamin-binding subunit